MDIGGLIDPACLQVPRSFPLARPSPAQRPGTQPRLRGGIAVAYATLEHFVGNKGERTGGGPSTRSARADQPNAPERARGSVGGGDHRPLSVRRDRYRDRDGVRPCRRFSRPLAPPVADKTKGGTVVASSHARFVAATDVWWGWWSVGPMIDVDLHDVFVVGSGPDYDGFDRDRRWVNVVTGGT